MTYFIIIFIATLIITILAIICINLYDSKKLWKTAAYRLSDCIKEKDNVICKQQEWLSEKDASIKVLNEKLWCAGNMIDFYSQRTKIGEYYIDDYVEKKLAPDLADELEKRLKLNRK